MIQQNKNILQALKENDQIHFIGQKLVKESNVVERMFIKFLFKDKNPPICLLIKLINELQNLLVEYIQISKLSKTYRHCKFIETLISQIKESIKSLQLSDFLHKFIFMRSLYTSDIQGTKPRLRIVEKSYFKMKHQQQVMRDPKNPDRSHQFQWFTSLPKSNKPQYTRQPYLNTIKLISEHTGTSRSMHIQSLKKHNSYFQPERMRNYSVLGNSGLSMVNKSRTQINEGNNPYYPHRIRQNYDQSNSTRFTGNRNWNYNPNTQIRLPDPQSEYVSKWVRL